MSGLPVIRPEGLGKVILPAEAEMGHSGGSRKITMGRASLLGVTSVVLLALTFGSLSIRLGAPQKWDAAGFWTLVVFASVIELSRRRWKEVDFWRRLLIIGLVHVAAIWIIFSRVIGAVRVPLLLTIPFIWAEVAMIVKLVHARDIRGKYRASVE
jgi:hypothetical protein